MAFGRRPHERGLTPRRFARVHVRALSTGTAWRRSFPTGTAWRRSLSTGTARPAATAATGSSRATRTRAPARNMIVVSSDTGEPPGAVAQAVEMHVERVEQIQTEVHERRIERRPHVPPRFDLAAARSHEHDREIMRAVQVAVPHRAAGQQDRMIEKRSVAVGR